MRTLNCKRTARLLSLYVAGDLEGSSERAVTAHLAACETCRRVADGFSESSSLLTQACAPPEFGAEFYSGIRVAVLGELTRNRRPLKPSLFRARWLYATSFAAVVIAAGVMLQHYRGVERQVPTVSAGAVTGQPVVDHAKGPASALLPHLPALPGSPRKAHPQMVQALRPPTSAGSVVQQASTSSGGTASSSSGSAPASQVSSIEIQTANPNIRIIWLTPRESGETEKPHREQDPKENGDRN